MSLLSGLGAYYSFVSLLADSTGNGNTLTNVGGVTQGTGPINKAAVVNGSDWLTAANDADVAPLTDFSVAFWFNQTSAGASDSILGTADFTAAGGNGTGYAFQVRTVSNKVRFLVYPSFKLDVNGFVDTTGTVSYGAWNFVVASWDNTAKSLRVRLNGATADVQGSGNASGYAAGAQSLFLGSAFSSNSMTGSVAEVGIWDRVLTSAEEDSLWNSGVGRTYPLGVTMARQINFLGQSANKSFSDTFTRADATTLGSNWDQVLGAFTITSNSAQDNGSPDMATVHSWSLTNSNQSVSVGAGPRAQVGLAARVQSNHSAYVLILYHNVSAPVFSVILGILSSDGVTVTSLGFTSVSSGLHTLRLDLHGANLTGYIDGVATLTAQDATITGPGGVGIYALAPLTPGQVTLTNYKATGPHNLTLTGQT